MRANVQPLLQARRTTADRKRALVTLLFALIVVSILLVLWPTTQSMVQIWRQSATYGHCYLVIPVAAWMVWRESAALVSVTPTPFYPGFAVTAGVGAIWLLGELASAAIVTQFAAVGMIVATALTVFGRAWTRELALPLGFLFFAVPFGEELLPLLMEWTADFTVGALRVTGVPVYREGNYFVVPGGSWSVIEACGGVRFLIAALMAGCIFAWLQYRSLSKRIVFVSGAIAVALVANWLRAYTIVLIGHLSGSQGRLDHDWWGWLIFGSVMFGLFALGLRWTDKDSGAYLPPARSGRKQMASRHSIVTVLAASLLTVAAWPAGAAWFESRLDMRPVRIEPIAPGGGWRAAPVARGDWTPELVAPSAVDVQTFVRGDDTVSVYRGVYRGQGRGSELVNTKNQIVRTDSERWRLIGNATAEVRLNGESTSVRTAVVRGANGQFLIWHWYWLAGHATISATRAKVELAYQRLTGATDTAAWIAVYTPVGDDTKSGVQRLTAFIETMSGPIDAAVATTAGR